MSGNRNRKMIDYDDDEAVKLFQFSILNPFQADAVTNAK